MSHKNHGGNWIRKERRVAIYMRDGSRCVYCGSRRRLTLDHVKPRAMGGTSRNGNLVTCCNACNTSKHSLSLRRWMLKRGQGRARTAMMQRLVSKQLRRGMRDRVAFARRMIAYGKQLKRGEGNV